MRGNATKMGYGNAVIFKRAESNRKLKPNLSRTCTCVNISKVYVTPPFFHETITYLPTYRDHLSRVKAENCTSVGTDSIMRLVSTKPFIHWSAFPLVRQLFSSLSFSFYLLHCISIFSCLLLAVVDYVRFKWQCDSNDIDQMSAKWSAFKKTRRYKYRKYAYSANKKKSYTYIYL